MPAHLWQSTGLYAKAGTVVEVEVPPELVNNSMVTFSENSQQNNSFKYTIFCYPKET
jgi:hypothetical protein